MAKRLLLVEDDDDVQAMLRSALEAEGYTVEARSDGAQARAAVEATAPDLIVLDLMMPVRDGVTVLADLNALSDRPPVLVLSAYLPQAKGEELVAPWGAAFLAKPVDLYGDDGLVARIAALVAGDA